MMHNSQEFSSSYSADLIKINLSDGTIAASTRLSSFSESFHAACVFGDVVYTASEVVEETLQLTSLSSGDSIGEVPGIARRLGPLAVSAWGLASGTNFYPATEWLDS